MTNIFLNHCFKLLEFTLRFFSFLSRLIHISWKNRSNSNKTLKKSPYVIVNVQVAKLWYYIGIKFESNPTNRRLQNPLEESTKSRIFYKINECYLSNNKIRNEIVIFSLSKIFLFSTFFLLLLVCCCLFWK